MRASGRPSADGADRGDASGRPSADGLWADRPGRAEGGDAMKLSGAAAIVTGGGSGLGRATAEALAAKGAQSRGVRSQPRRGGRGRQGGRRPRRRRRRRRRSVRRRGDRESRRGAWGRAGARQLRRHRHGQTRRRPRRASPAARLREGDPRQPDRQLQHDPPCGRGDGQARTDRRRARRHHLDGLGRGLRRPDRPGGLFRLQGRRGGDDVADRARTGADRRSSQRDRAGHLHDADAVRAAAGGAGFARARRCRSLSASGPPPNTPRSPCISSRTAISTARRSASTARFAWRRNKRERDGIEQEGMDERGRASRRQGRAHHRRGVRHRPGDGGSVPRRGRESRRDRPQRSGPRGSGRTPISCWPRT